MPFFGRLVLILSLAVDFIPAALFADEADTAPRTFDVKAIDGYLTSQVKEKGFVGLSVAIMKDGKQVFVKGYGKTAVKDGTSINDETMFAAGSITKQFTCACILLLAEEGKLTLKDNVAAYYPKATKASEITIYDLMTHVSGYPDYYPLDFVHERMAKKIELDKLIEEYASGKLDFEPGTRWSYSNTGYIILGRIVEKVSGQAFADFLHQRIFKPLNMKHTAFEPKPGAMNQAIGHSSFARGDAEPALSEGEGWIHAAGGLYTTPEDLCIWDLALMEGRLLKPASYELMTTPRKLKDGRTKNYGCGLTIISRDGDTILQHNGAVSGFLAFNAMIPRTQSAVVLMANTDHVDAGKLHAELLALVVTAGAGDAPAIPKVDGPPAKEAAIELLHQLQAGQVKREKLGDDYNHYLSPERVEGARDRLKPLGEPDEIEVLGLAERGGMEVALIRFTFKKVKFKASLYRTPDGKIQQFLISRS